MPETKRKIGGVSREMAPMGGPGPAAPAHGDPIYNGGPVITCLLIYATFWGSHWSDATHQAQSARLIQFLKDLVASTWMNIMSQYGAGSGAGSGLYVQSSFISSVPANLTDASIHTVLQGAINAGTIPEPSANNTTQVNVIFLDESVAVKDPALGVVMCEPTGDNAFGYHLDFVTAKGNNCYYAVIPALDDKCINETCPGGCSLNLSETQEQRRTQVTSHEFCRNDHRSQVPHRLVWRFERRDWRYLQRRNHDHHGRIKHLERAENLQQDRRYQHQRGKLLPGLGGCPDSQTSRGSGNSRDYRRGFPRPASAHSSHSCLCRAASTITAREKAAGMKLMSGLMPAISSILWTTATSSRACRGRCVSSRIFWRRLRKGDPRQTVWRRLTAPHRHGRVHLSA